MKVGICSRTDRPAAVDAAASAARALRAKGQDVVEVSLGSSTLPSDLEGASVVCVFGGDGTMLRAARLIAPLGIPLLGV
ncbi:MAG: NAD(+)/NADH kinase, partial [Chloroflexi bacterium]|nr:NAD(+)/NADH kinase [Chloroflexota bacterium]